MRPQTNRAIEALKPQAKPYIVTVDRSLLLRVAPDGRKTFLVRFWVAGKPRQHTLPQPFGQIGLRDAIAEAARIQAAGRAGVDSVAQAQAQPDPAEGATFADALREYVERKRRAKDGKPLADRTRADYLLMLDHELQPLARRRLGQLTAGDLRRTHAAVVSPRRQSYAAQVMRAVLRWHGVAIEGNPFDAATPGRDRIAVPPTAGQPSPIPADRLGAWWREARAGRSAGARALRFMLLSGCRPGEATGARVRDADLGRGTLRLLDTKNRTDHVVLLSRQAWAEVADGARLLRAGVAPGPDDLLFGVEDVRAVLRRVNARAGTPGVTPHKLRHTFGSLGDALLPAGVVRRLMNHAAADVTDAFYVGKTAAELRAGWQTIADTLDAAAEGRQLGADRPEFVDPLG